MKKMNENLVVTEMIEEAGGAGGAVAACAIVCLLGAATGPIALEVGAFGGIGFL